MVFRGIREVGKGPKDEAESDTGLALGRRRRTRDAPSRHIYQDTESLSSTYQQDPGLWEKMFGCNPNYFFWVEIG